MTTWEYLVKGVPIGRGLHFTTFYLSKIGIEGWELVSVEDDIAYFKREVRELSIKSSEIKDIDKC